MAQNWPGVGSTCKGERRAEPLWWRGCRTAVSEALTPLLAIALAGCTAAAGPLPEVTIASCYDGDTCRTTAGEKIRLACIDTPELRGAKADPIPARAARDYLRSFLAGKTITIRRITTDRYGRTVAELFADGANAQEQLVAAGHAEIYWRYAKPCPWANG